MLTWPPPAGRYERRRLLAHEMFHRLQAERRWPAHNPGNAHLDSEAGRTWLRLEWRALRDALAHTGSARTEAVHDALLFRMLRHRLFPDGAAEGLAEYTGMRVTIPEDARAGWLMHHLDNHDASAARTSVVRNFAHASGPAYGVLLDAASQSWRARVFDAGDMAALLGAAHHVSIVSSDLDVQARAQRYGGEQLFTEEATREAQRVEQQARFRERFATGPTLVLPASGDVRYSFDPNAVVPFDDGGTVYLTTTVRDEWGTLTVTEGGAVLVSERDRVVRVIVPAPSGATMKTNDREVTVRGVITVEAPIERAFRVFTERCDAWWPRSYRLGRAERIDVVLETHVGGRWYERTADGRECDWGTVLSWDPPLHLTLSWRIGTGFVPEPDPACASRVDVKFEDAGAARTTVTIVHSEFERHGQGWESMRDGVSRESGWPGILCQYAEVIALERGTPTGTE